MLLSIVLPAYNEENRIGRTLDELVAYSRDSSHEIEALVVDDGSTDAGAEVAESYANRLPGLRVIAHDENRGKGRAVATGMLAARGSYKAFLDADGATPVAEVDKLLQAAMDNPRTVAIGSIRVEGTDVTRRQPLRRLLAGRAGAHFIRVAVLPGVRDSQRGCKLFPGPVADAVFGAQRVDGWAFDIEVLALCQRLGHTVLEVPIVWRHIGGGQIRTSSYVSTLAEVIRIRRMLRAGVHELGPAPRTERARGYIEQTAV